MGWQTGITAEADYTVPATYGVMDQAANNMIIGELLSAPSALTIITLRPTFADVSFPSCSIGSSGASSISKILPPSMAVKQVSSHMHWKTVAAGHVYYKCIFPFAP